MTTVHIEQRHIDEGKQCNIQGCPAALAIREKTGKPAWVQAHHIEFHNKKRGVVEVAYLSKEIKQWIRAFDWMGKNSAKPTSFKLVIDREYKYEGNPIHFAEKCLT